MIWDRNSTRKIFDFDYKWEVYRPVAKRQYGYYVLPILYKNRFIGRIEPCYEKKKRSLRGNIGYGWRSFPTAPWLHARRYGKPASVWSPFSAIKINRVRLAGVG